MPSPNPGGDSVLYSVAATPDGTAWAVGWTDSGTTLILRWNGTTWTQVPSPSPGGDSVLYSVAATSAGSAWAVGWTGNGTSSSRTLILRWNGNTWTAVPNPSPAGSLLYSVAATPDGTAWAVGCTGGTDCGTDTGTGTRTRSLLLRWNGTAWTRVPSPGPDARLLGVTALSDSDAWAVGIADGETLILRWNGQTWSGPAGQVSPAAAPASSSAPASAPAAASFSAPAISATAASSSAESPGRQAAQALASLLAQSGIDRAAVTHAVSAVQDCSADLSRDEMIFGNAAASRQALLGKLVALPDRSALPASMLQDLTTAWQASGQADQDFANWAHDEIAQGCSTDYQSDASYQAATVPDDQATKDKKAFAALWTAVADQYGLPLYKYNQI